MTEEQIETLKQWHHQEAVRIKDVLSNVGSEFADDGIVKTVLRQRVEQEQSRAKGIGL